MKLLKPALVIFLLLCAALAGLLAYLHFADLNTYRSRIEAAGTEALGRELRLAGDLELDLWPQVLLEANDLHLANAEWGSEPEMARLGHFSLRIDPLSVFRGPLRILDLRLADVDVLMETSADGESNWVFSDTRSTPAPAGGSRGGESLAIWLEQAEVERVRFRQRSKEGEEEREVSLSSLALEANPEGELELSGQGEVFTLPLAIAGRAGPMLVFEQTGALDYELSFNLGDTRLAVEGEREAPAGGAGSLHSRLEVSGLQALLDHLALPLTIPGQTTLDLVLREAGDGLEGHLDGQLGDVTLTAQLAGDDRALSIEGVLTTLQGLANIAGVSGLPDVPLEFATSLGFDDGLQLHQLELSAGDTRLAASGKVGGSEAVTTLKVEARGEQAATWHTALPAQPFALSAQLDLSAAELVADPLLLELGESDLQGSVRVLTAEAPAVTLDLQSRRIDLPQLTGTEVAGAPTSVAGGTEAQAGKQGAKRSASKQRYVFTDDPLPFGALQGNEIDGHWTIEELVTPVLGLESVDLVASLHQGRLTADTSFSGAQGGVGRNHLEIASEGESGTLLLSNRLRGLRVNLASGEVSQASDIPPLDLTLDLTAMGASARAMAESSEGDILLTFGRGLLSNNLMERYSGDILAQLVTALNPFAQTQTQAQLQCVVVGVDIEEGLAQIDPVLLQSAKLQVVAGGTLDLNTEKLNIEFNTRPRSGVGVSADMFVTPFVSLEGTLSRPGVGMNETSTLLTAGAAMATGGMSILWKGMLDRASGALDQCKTTLQEYQHPALEDGAPIRPPASPMPGLSMRLSPHH
ncbi:AsmA family protein [Parahaliea maris]|uniref:AsmA family protein n=1 Tax=Parahaliea maris TaxID=2716870 RepID=A0A5C9A5E7_9GAMM|nr:AsmA family protein [Parahaliea maris]TXS95202.1 AsmA family protein [Parahaliea maris]